VTERKKVWQKIKGREGLKVSIPLAVKHLGEGTLTDDDMATLRHCAEFTLRAGTNTRQIEEMLESFRKSVEEDGQIPASAKKFMLFQLARYAEAGERERVRIMDLVGKGVLRKPPSRPDEEPMGSADDGYSSCGIDVRRPAALRLLSSQDESA
jgi:hypothetical protein